MSVLSPVLATILAGPASSRLTFSSSTVRVLMRLRRAADAGVLSRCGVGIALGFPAGALLQGTRIDSTPGWGRWGGLPRGRVRAGRICGLVCLGAGVLSRCGRACSVFLQELHGSTQRLGVGAARIIQRRGGGAPNAWPRGAGWEHCGRRLDARRGDVEPGCRRRAVPATGRYQVFPRSTDGAYR